MARLIFRVCRAGRLAGNPRFSDAHYVKPGVTTEELDRLCHDFILEHGATPAPLGLQGLSEVYLHLHQPCRLPWDSGPRKLENGDILNIDVTVILNGWHGDTSRMFGVGKVGVKARRLIDITYESLMRGIAVVKPGATLGDIGYAIQTYAESERCSVVRDFCGHGLGRAFHAAPSVLHYGEKGIGPLLQEGMFFTIEPMLNDGKHAVKILPDGWTAVTRDRSLSAQFEHSIGVTETGCEIFTESLPKGYAKPPYAD